MNPARPSILAVTLLALLRAAGAQSSPGAAPDSPVFAVSVIRPTATQDVMGSSHSHMWGSATNSLFRAENVTPLQLIQSAFNIPEDRIQGGPDWIRSKRFDLEAKADPEVDQQLSKLPSDAARDLQQHMRQALLADRFALKVHEETRTLPIYALLVAKGGPKFTPSQKNGTSTSSTNDSNGNMTMTVQGSDHTLRLLAEQLSRSVGRVVVDKTGLDGRFDLTLKWVSSDDLRNTGPDALSGPSLFTALQEQLGLKLESEKGPVTILVIDHIDPPLDN